MSPAFTYQFDTPSYKGPVTIPTGLFINGEFVDPVEKQTLEVFNPATGKAITKIAAGSPTDVDIAVEAAKKAFKTSWGLKVPGVERGVIISKLADLMTAVGDEFAALDALSNGKSFANAKRDYQNAIRVFRYYAGWADKITGKTIETNDKKVVYTRHEPIGVVGCIIPWNVPLFSLSLKIGPALATGNAVILKPSELTPLSALRVASLFNEAGFPPGVINVINGYGATVGQAMSEHMAIEKIAFTGSTLTGRKIMMAAAKSNLKSVTLELGGKSPTIIFDDADMDQAVKWAAHGIYANHGQNCSAGSRIFVQEAIYEDFLKRFAAHTAALKLGDPFDLDTYQGPQVSETQFNRVMGYIQSGKDDGAKVLIGGSRHGKEGYFVQPTVFTDCSPSMKIAREEIFGPVAVVFKFSTEEEVIELANDTQYGLATSVFTKDIDRALRMAHSVEAGNSWVNFTNGADIGVPFGGFKQSGIGRDLGEYALENYTNVRAVSINVGQRL